MTHAIQLTGQQITGFAASRPEDRIIGDWLQVTPEQFSSAQGTI